MTHDPTWDFQDPAGKGRLLGVLRRELDGIFDLAADPSNWNTPTACPGWELRDMVGHLLDATDSYLAGFDIARRGGTAPPSVGVAGMAVASDEAARAYRSTPRDELLARFRDRTDQLLAEFEPLSDAEWSGLIVPDRYMGPLPAMILAAGMLGGATVHGWDIREGMGAPHAISGDAADLLVPFVYLLWWATADTSSVEEPYAIGIRTGGHNGGDTRCDVTNAGLQFSAADIEDCPAILEFDPASLVLTGYNRINSGTVRGETRFATNFRSLFIAI
jgi:uncharacterized protein (TIGR03083 family)